MYYLVMPHVECALFHSLNYINVITFRPVYVCLIIHPSDVCFFEKDVVSHNKKMKNIKNKTNSADQTTGDGLGLKGLSKGKRRKLEAYQHLFYLLQVKP